MDIKEYVVSTAKLAKESSRQMANLSTDVKNKTLIYMADSLIKNMSLILEANNIDMESGKKCGMPEPLLDRLLLNENRIMAMADGLIKIAALPDPIGNMKESFRTENNLQIGKISVPLGVIGIIYEARPNVTVDSAGLCIKSGNSVILKGGSEAINSCSALSSILRNAAIEKGLPDGCIQLLETTDRTAVNVLMKLNEYIDVLIPRGGAGLINAVVQNSSVPVIQTGVGNCHIYVDSDSNFEMAKNIIINAKTQRPGVCNAMETLLVHKDIAAKFLPGLIKKLKELNVEVRGCSITKSIVEDIKEATEEDFKSEFLDLILAVKVINSMDEAIEHIYKYSTKHSEAIITNNYFNAQKFLKEIDASAVYVNASTRFTDGGQFGFGSEIGISTQKLHARGPMGLNELTTYKYIIYGEGQIRN